VNSTMKTLVFWLVIVVAAYLLWHSVKSGGNAPPTPEISYSEFLTQAEAGNVGKVTISKNHANGNYRDGRNFRVTVPTSQEAMLQILHQKNVEIWFADAPEGDWPTWLMNLAPLILLAALWFFMIRQIKQRQLQSSINKQG